jgi:hypothetical protein
MRRAETYPVQVAFDGQAPIQLLASADSEALVTAFLPSDAVLEQFKKSHIMVAILGGQTYQFGLSSTGQLLPVIANCVAKVKTSGIANAGDFSVLPPKPPAPTPVKSQATASAPQAPSLKINSII